ncbi:polyketide synthase dehydratase domain-containing protein [Nonomuraea lactucae]|uniref:polyketide synthase dehydratase domain-containing protein n=1 Tax=Nonomuraea lactucae TaxID=2249762 RepID=UPI001F05C2CE|nr:polyketide synthase dehydratase domain-containing protein [Nonomuraea lactucae]
MGHIVQGAQSSTTIEDRNKEPHSSTTPTRGWSTGRTAYGPHRRGLTGAWQLDGETYAEVALPGEAGAAGYGLHPALLDAALHAEPLHAEAVLHSGRPGLPSAWSCVRVHAPCATRRAAFLRADPDGAATSPEQAVSPEPPIPCRRL